ncbi:MAG TPA: uroporphyrinogen-III C-methyltransferase [Usitatibacter sp.]|nr:uroporphyrinogen-III C-methyltransferase [Usitatibacter sp.]
MSAPEPPLSASPGVGASVDRLARLLAALALAATFAAAWLALDARTNVRSIEASAGGRLADLAAETAQASAARAQMQAALRDAQSRISELEGRVADTQEQRVALEQMYRDLARSADDRVLSEVEQMLVLANQQLQLAGNVRGALAALQAADQRLARAEKLSVAPLRRAIAQDMDRLKAVPQVDTVGIAVKIDGLIRQTDTLPLVISEAVAAPRPAVHWTASDDNAVVRAARDFWTEMKGLVRIREVEPADVALLTPAQGYFLRENLKLRLLSARVALLARDEPSFREDMRETQAWIGRYFDPRARATLAALATVKQLADTPVVIALPDINASLAAVRAARAAREKH